MPLGELDAFDDWVERDEPHPAVRYVVGRWIAMLGTAPWRAPSAPIAPIEDLSDQPRDEVRQAIVPDSDGVLVIYRHRYADDAVDLLYVGSDV